MSNQRLRDLLAAALADLPPGPLLVALSGGLDSTVLLHGLATLPAARERGLRAVHVDHRLQDNSTQWADHCRQYAAGLGVDLKIVAVDVERGIGIGLEAAARRARHAAFAAELGRGEFLALAHHRDDQTETVLLKLLRGAGPEGLGAMRVRRRLGTTEVWRPLLGLPRAALRAYAEHHQLAWIHDPSNADPSLDRNFLRLDALPRLRRRWPEADASIAQSAAWARAAAEFIENEAERALARLQGLDPRTLRYRDWLALPEALRDPVLRRWLRALGLPEPTHFQAAELLRQLAEAGEDRQPCVRWPGAELRRYRDLIHAHGPLAFPPPDWQHDWRGENLELPAGLGQLGLVAHQHAGEPILLPDPLGVRFRRGGETLRLPHAVHTRELRDLFQEAGIPPWERGRLPLVFDAEGTLLAVADLWLSERGETRFAQHGCRLLWRMPPH